MLWIKYRKLAFLDLMCNCHNRNYLEYKLYKKYKNKMCYITIIDIDNFKLINDQNGHLVGDAALRDLVEFFKEDWRILDICRFGGDELVLFHSHKIDFYEKKVEFFYRHQVNFSFGTEFKSQYQSISDVLEKSDQKLYRTKQKSH